MPDQVSRITGGEVFTGDSFEKRDVLIDAERFSDACGASGEVLDASGCYVLPGFVDIHFHGAAGADMSDGDLAGLHEIGAYEASRGIAAMCPATMTLSEAQLTRAARAARSYVPEDGEADLVGINMEGPYISPGKVGAQNPEHVRVPDADEFRRLQEASGGLFKLVDIAPEEDGADDFIEALHNDVRISLAHTCADYDTARRAFEKGARQLTHLYNAMEPMHHRKPGPIPAAIENPDVTAEIITDGIHIHPAMVRHAFRAFGDDRIILVSDTMRAAGMEDGTYDLGGQEVIVRGPEATLANGALAGSVSDLMRCFTVAVRDMGIPVVSAAKAVTVNPARAIAQDGDFGSLDVGHVASAVVLDAQTLDLKHVVVRGKLLF